MKPVDSIIEKSQLMQVFSAAFQEYTKQIDDKGKSLYQNLFEKYFGERWEAPTLNENNPEVEFPEYAELLKSNSPIVWKHVKIGTYDHKPYCYRNEDGEWEGWEFDIAEAVKEIIIDHYNEIATLDFEWIAAPIDESELPMDGSDNDDVKAILLDGLRNKEYHMVFSGTLLKGGGIEDYAFGSPTSNFYVSGVYTGRGKFGEIPTDSAESMLKKFAQKSNKEAPIRIVHTSNGGQTRIAKTVGDWITNEYSGEVSDWDVHIPSLFGLIQYGDPHIYVGDILQIMVMIMDEENYPNLQNLKLDFDSFNEQGGAYSSPNPEPESEHQPMQIAPFALLTT
ncbi:MAG: hypothetical protein JXR05_11045 [Flavobacteriaceae bacterium]